jgi:hypothetical protein
MQNTIKQVLAGRHSYIFWPLVLAVTAIGLEYLPGFYDHTLGLSNKGADRLILTFLELYVAIVCSIRRQWLLAALTLTAATLFWFT